MNLALAVYIYSLTGLIVMSSFIKIVLKLSNKYDEVPNHVQVEEAISIPFILLGCVAIFGAIYYIPVFNALFWQTYTVLFLVYMLISFQLPKMTWLRTELSKKWLLIWNALNLVVSGPFLFLLIKYAFIDFPPK